MTLIPGKLKRGDTVGIVSPSTPVGEEFAEQLEKGVAFWEFLGFNVLIGEHVRSATLGYAASPEEKAADINRMFADDAVGAIHCSQGGATANACLPFLDYDAIRVHPKIFVGMSDISVLLNAIHHKTGLVTFHGIDLMWGLGRKLSSYDRQEFISRLIDGQIGAIPPSQERKTVRSGVAEGKLLGGNIHALLKLAGTPYFPDLRGSILFLEAVGVKPENCDSLFRQLAQMGVFDHIGGVVVGFILGLQDDEGAPAQMEDVLMEVTAAYDFPILKTEDFGHNCPNTVLPVGGRLRLNADEKTMEIVEEMVC